MRTHPASPLTLPLVEPPLGRPPRARRRPRQVEKPGAKNSSLKMTRKNIHSRSWHSARLYATKTLGYDDDAAKAHLLDAIAVCRALTYAT